MDGTSGPGVGAATMSVQEGAVGMMISNVGVPGMEGVLVFCVQEAMRSEKSRTKRFFMWISRDVKANGTVTSTGSPFVVPRKMSSMLWC